MIYVRINRKRLTSSLEFKQVTYGRHAIGDLFMLPDGDPFLPNLISPVVVITGFNRDYNEGIFWRGRGKYSNRINGFSLVHPNIINKKI